MNNDNHPSRQVNAQRPVEKTGQTATPVARDRWTVKPEQPVDPATPEFELPEYECFARQLVDAGSMSPDEYATCPCP